MNAITNLYTKKFLRFKIVEFILGIPSFILLIWVVYSRINLYWNGEATPEFESLLEMIKNHPGISIVLAIVVFHPIFFFIKGIIGLEKLDKK